MKKVWRLAQSAVLCLFLASCSNAKHIYNYTDRRGPRYCSSLYGENRTPKDTAIKVISYNIELCQNIDQAIKLIAHDAALKGADIICLQEMCLEGTYRMAQELKLHFIYYPSSTHPESGNEIGNAILSRWPITDDTKTILPFIKEDKYLKLQRIAVTAVIMPRGVPIMVISTHLGVFISQAQRKKQVETILETIPDHIERCIIAGDFNSYASSHVRAIAKSMKQAGFTHATGTVNSSFRSWFLFNKKIVLDHIFTKGMPVLEAGSMPRSKASDHVPIWATLKSTGQ